MKNMNVYDKLSMSPLPQPEMIKTLELFGGIGAPRKALEQLGFDIDPIAYVEIIPCAVTAYNSMFVREYQPHDILTWNLRPDILIHGSPCQDFSKNGLNDVENGGRSILYNRTLQILREELVTPAPVVIWENVPNLLSQGKKVCHKVHFDHYIESMKQLGYKSFYKVLNAAYYGIPQARERVFTVSILESKLNGKEFTFPAPSKEPWRNIVDYLDPNATADMESLQLTENEKKLFFYNKEGVLCVKEGTKTGYKEVPDGAVINVEYPTSATRRGRVQLGMTHTLTCSPREAIYLNGELRILSAKEQLMLMGFDAKDYDRMKACGINDRQVSHLAGNSICVPVLKAIYEELDAMGLMPGRNRLI